MIAMKNGSNFNGMKKRQQISRNITIEMQRNIRIILYPAEFPPIPIHSSIQPPIIRIVHTDMTGKQFNENPFTHHIHIFCVELVTNAGNWKILEIHLTIMCFLKSLFSSLTCFKHSILISPAHIHTRHTSLARPFPLFCLFSFCALFGLFFLISHYGILR